MQKHCLVFVTSAIKTELGFYVMLLQAVVLCCLLSFAIFDKTQMEKI